MTVDELEQICTYATRGRLALFIDDLNASMDEFEINTPPRQAAFIAQVGHESGCFKYLRELASGAAYEGRQNLGNTQKGDGIRFKGRGLIQITGRTNYQKCGDALGLDLIAHPELLEQPSLACRSAGWWWQAHHLNELADEADFEHVTRVINGGLNGWNDRLALYERAQAVLV